MFSKAVMILSFLVIQLFSTQTVQAQTNNQPFLSESDFVKSQLQCNGDDKVCLGQFVINQLYYFINVPQCTSYDGNNCLGYKIINFYGMDAFDVLNHYLAIDNERVLKSVNYTITFTRLETNFETYSGSTKLIFKRYYVNNDNPSVEYLYNDNAVDSRFPLACNGYVDGLGCLNEFADRTHMADAPCEICSKIGNPFDVRNGAKYEHAIDINFPISLERNYSSLTRVTGMFGLNWRSNFDKTLKIVQNNNVISALVFTNPEGESIVFQSNNGSDFTVTFKDQRAYKVSINNGQITLLRPDSGFEIYDLASSRIISETFKGKTLTYQYNTYGLMSRVTDAFGRYLQFSYSSYANVIDQITASNGDVLSYTYDGGNVNTVSFNSIPQITYQYSGVLITGKLNGAGIQYASYSYDEQGRGIENKWITSDGHEIKKYNISYNGNTTIVTQANGFSRTYYMNKYNYAQKITYMEWNGYTESTNINADGDVTSKTDLDGVSESYGYDSAGRLNSVLRDGKTTTVNWDTDRNIAAQYTESTSAGPRTTYIFYDNNGNDLGSQSTGAGGEVHIYKNVDSYGRLTRESNDQGLVKVYTYYPIDINTNENGLLKTITSNTGQTIVINSYDVRGKPTSITINGVTKTITYDYKGRVLTESVNGATNIYTYDIDGNMLTATMATGYQLSMTYDSAGRLLNITDNMGGNTSFGIDDYTNEVLNTSISQNNALVRARNKVLDSLGRTTQIWNATDRTKQYNNYSSKFSVPDSKTDANGIQSSYGWNSQGEVTAYASGNDSNNNGYDVDGNLTNILINGQTTSMTYDALGRITSINSPDSGNKSFSYGQSQDQSIDAKGTVHSVTKGIGGLPVVVNHTNNDSAYNYSNYESYQYDTYGRVNKINSNNSEIDFTRNNLGQLTTESVIPFVSGFKSFNIQYGYDTAGQKTSETYPSGMVINYGYTNGFLTSISAGGTTVISNVQYNSMLKEAVSWNLAGSQVNVSKDADGLITGFTDSGAFNQSISTDNEGHVTSMVDSVNSDNFSVSLNQNYGLMTGSMNGKTLNYSFGTNQNLSSQQDGITNYTFGYVSNTNKLATLSNSVNTINYTYDVNGNVTSNQHGTMKYDGNNNLEYFTDSNGNMTRYYYNGLGQRIAKWIQGGQLTYFVYNNNNQLLGEYDSSGNAIAEYVYFGLRPVAVKRNGTLYTVHTDYLATPRVVTSGGSMVWQWRNDNPYGNNQAQGSIEFNLRFAGQYYDYESGLHYNMNRTYDPQTGRYIQSDPIGLAGGFNTYNYVNRNPLDGVDPLGLDGFSGTNDSILSGAIHSDTSVPMGELGITMHSKTYWSNNQITAIIEVNSELYNIAKMKHPNWNIFKSNENLNLTAEGLADFLNQTLDMNKYNSVTLMSCSLADSKYVDKYSGDIFAQTFASAIKKKSFAYSAYIVGEKVGTNYFFSGYYTNPTAFRLQYLGLSYMNFDTTYVESRNAETVKKEFNPR